MNIEELKNLGVIPNDIPDNVMLQIFNKIGINTYDPKMKLSQDQISRILYSTQLNDYKVRTTMSNSHRGVLAKYDELIKGYAQILQGIYGRSGFDQERQAISGLLTKLQNERASYQNQINGFGLSNVSQYFAFGNNNKVVQGTNDLFKTIAKNTQQQQQQVDEKLDKLYKKLDIAKKSQNRTITGKLKSSIRIRKLESKINKLRNKQGKLRNTQSKILNANTGMYLGKMNRRFEQYFRELNSINDMVEEKKYMMDEIDASLNEQNEMNLNAVNIQANMVNANAFGRVVLNAKGRKNSRDIEKMRKHIERLQKKAGRVNLTVQYSEAFNRSYAR